MSKEIKNPDEHDWLTETQREAIEWAERNNFGVFEDRGVNFEQIKIKIGYAKYVYIGEHGNVRIEKMKHLGGEEGEITFGEKRMTITDGYGKKKYVSDKQFPIE